MRLHSSVGRTLHQYRRSDGFESHWSLRICFWAFSFTCKDSYDCWKWPPCACFGAVLVTNTHHEIGSSNFPARGFSQSNPSCPISVQRCFVLAHALIDVGSPFWPSWCNLSNFYSKYFSILLFENAPEKEGRGKTSAFNGKIWHLP